jgi:hypothetical protein
MIHSVFEALREGWTMQAEFHLRTFTSNAKLWKGVLAPIVHDLFNQQWFAKKLGTEELWTTNGLDTIRIPRAGFG